MSAFMCSDLHISLIANAASGEAAGKDAAFKVLIAENVRSLNHRYPGEESWGEDEAVRIEAPASELIASAMAERSPRSRRFAGELNVVALATQIVKACDCYDYQACETNDYQQSEAAKLVEQVRQQAIEIGGEQSGGKLYDQMIWGLD